MLILSNCLTEISDEGCLKVANSLVKRIKQADPAVTIVSYERKSSITDRYLKLNKLLLNCELISLLRKQKDSILYIPFPARTFATALRIFILSLFARKKLNAVLVMKYHISLISKLLLKLSGADLVVFSKEAEEFYGKILGTQRVAYLKTGVDTQRFVPVLQEKSNELKAKYGFDPQKPVILHVGHLNLGRGVDELMKFDQEYQVLLVTSTLTKEEQDVDLRERLLSRPNIRIIDTYIPDIEEIYQMADVYFFPTKASGHCIDVPLSCMEAAACNKPILTTDYGEMKEFVGRDGFVFIDTFDQAGLNEKIQKALELKNVNTRASVLEYDWSNAITHLMKL